MDFQPVLRYKIRAMWGLIKRLFRRDAIDTDSLQEERWSTDFSSPRNARFREEQEESYRSRLTHNGYELEVLKKNSIVWTENSWFRYTDLMLETVLAFQGSSYAAAGVLFRYSDEGDYYSLLVSNKGFFRLDAVFNGSPMPLMAWTEFSDTVSAHTHVKVRIIVLGDRMCVILNDAWTGEVTDNTHSSGRIALTVADYGEPGTVSVKFLHLKLDSRPVDVEADFIRWNSYIRIDPEARIRLAETFLASNQALSALVQLKRAWKQNRDTGNAAVAAGEPGNRSPKELLLAADCALRLSLIPEAEEYLDRCVETDPDSEDAHKALAEKAKLLYLANRFADLREHAEAAISYFPEDPSLWNLLGHAFWNLRAWRKSAEAYDKALTLDPTNGLLAQNTARALERSGDPESAFEHYLRAGNAFLASESYDDLAGSLARLSELDHDNFAVRALAGKYAFALEDWTRAETELVEAERLFREKPSDGQSAPDATIPYLRGLLRTRTGKREEAIPFFRLAIELEPGFVTFRFRLAECLFLIGSNPSDPDLTRELQDALAIGPEDPWLVNLAAQVYLAKGDLEAAARFVEKAAGLLPDEPAVRANKAELGFLRGEPEKALAILDYKGTPENGQTQVQAHPKADDPKGELANATGHILARLGRWEEAVGAYAQALTAAPDDPDYLRNKASCLIELGLFGEADEALAKSYELYPGTRTLDLIAYVAIKKGEYPRAEACYRIGLERKPEDPSLLAGLAWTLLSMGRWKAAEEIILRLERSSQPGSNAATKAAELREHYTEATTRKVSCAACALTWKVDKFASATPGIRLVAEPPDDMPAGSCTSCGKTLCIGCAKKYMNDGRFICPDCGERLKLLDEGLKKILSDWAARNATGQNQQRI